MPAISTAEEGSPAGGPLRIARPGCSTLRARDDATAEEVLE